LSDLLEGDTEASRGEIISIGFNAMNSNTTSIRDSHVEKNKQATKATTNLSIAGIPS
jgi:hypothetical protein